MSTVVVPGSDRSNAFMVVTHVFPSAATGQNGAGPQPTATALPVSAVPNTAPEYTGDTGVILNRETAAPEQFVKFLKVHPKAMGTVQIMIGIIHLLFAIVLSVSASRAIDSGVVFWGPVIYFLSGSYTIIAENRLNSRLMEISLKLNGISAVTGGVAFAMLMHVTVLIGRGEYGYDKSLFTSQTAGITGVLAILSLLQAIINICILSFGCKTTCCSKPPVPVIANAPTHATRSMGNVYQTTNGQQNLFYVNPSVNLINPPYSPPSDRPPAYS
ncbi:membrane-spanning 4-domains subfamily A member 4D-like [Astyanax mexicanus]|uniref:Membrane-spanning 4-domains subfamily A member 4D-like n=2 Tax=Astyanax mexicanus TaxID=7994 RepID=A0A8B9L1P1_ASTMX|nr:membrane-spanning 4-domains subfamily A member 4D-like [Astyanax mexicanus]